MYNWNNIHNTSDIQDSNWEMVEQQILDGLWEMLEQQIISDWWISHSPLNSELFRSSAGPGSNVV